MRRFYLTVAFAAAAGSVSVAQAGSYGLNVNGTCEVGSCPATSAQGGGGSSDTGPYNIELPNGDLFQENGTIGISNLATGLTALGSFKVTYEGNAVTGATAASQADTVTVVENYLFNTSPTSLYGTNYTGYEQTTGSFGTGVASGSSLVNTYTSNGTAVGTYGPYVSPASIGGPLTLFNVVNLGTWTTTDSITVSFAAGSALFSQIVFDSSFGATAVPLPPTVWLMLAGLGGLLLSQRRRLA
jgi:hypothetical protein